MPEGWHPIRTGVPGKAPPLPEWKLSESEILQVTYPDDYKKRQRRPYEETPTGKKGQTKAKKNKKSKR
eukprot:5061623-Prymnesium_polylepis.1